MKKTSLRPIIECAVFFAIVILIPVVSFLIVQLSGKINPKLPRVDIYLNNTSLEEINSGDKSIVYAGNGFRLKDGSNVLTAEGVELKGRGNSTWSVTGKKPYQIHFQDKTQLFDLGFSRNWILLAEAFDGSYLRNDTALLINRIIGGNYPIDGRHIELYIDDEFVGLYYLTPKVEIGKDRVALSDPYGVLVELDNLHNFGETCVYAGKPDCLIMNGFVDVDNAEEVTKSFSNKYDKLYQYAEQGDLESFSEVADVDSFARYFLLSEFTVNPDAYVSSCYMYSDGENDLVHMATAWDYDFSLGNLNWDWAMVPDFHSPDKDMAQRIMAFGGSVYDTERGGVYQIETNETYARLFYYLIDIPQFRELVSTIYDETLARHKTTIIDSVRNKAAFIRDVAIRDTMQCWGDSRDFDKEVEYLIDWITKRFEHFDETYGPKNLRPWNDSFVL